MQRRPDANSEKVDKSMGEQSLPDAAEEDTHTQTDETPHVRRFPEDATIIQEGAPDDGSIYILETGKLGVFKDEQMVSEISEPGLIVGEMAPILGSSRTATIRTVTECEITVYTGDLRKRLIERLPPVTQRIMIAMTKRLQHQTELHARALEGARSLEAQIESLQQTNRRLQERIDELTQAAEKHTTP